MKNPDGVSDTLFIPLEGRLYATEKHPEVLVDKEILSLKKQFPEMFNLSSGQTEYTLLASACRAFNLDSTVREFLRKYPDGMVVNIGAGLETAFSRVDNGMVRWYDLDLPEVIEKRNKYIQETDRNKNIAISVFDTSWMKKVNNAKPSAVLIIAAGLLYYFKEKDVIQLLRDLKANIDNVEIAFDAVCKKGLRLSNKFVKKTGNKNALMYFYMDNPEEFFEKNIEGVRTVNTLPYYRNFLEKISKKCSFKTRIIMKISDRFKMVWLIHAKL